MARNSKQQEFEVKDPRRGTQELPGAHSRAQQRQAPPLVADVKLSPYQSPASGSGENCGFFRDSLSISGPWVRWSKAVEVVRAAAPTAGSANPFRGRPGGAAAAPAAGAAARTARAGGGGRRAARPDGSVRAGGRRRVAAQRAHRAHLLLSVAARPAAGLSLLLALARVPLLPGAVAPAPHLPPRLARGAAAAGVPHAQVRLVRAGAACRVRRGEFPERRRRPGRRRRRGRRRHGHRGRGRRGPAALLSLAGSAARLLGAGVVRAAQHPQQQVVAALPEHMTASFDSSEASFQLVICVLTLGLLAVFVLLWRGFRSIQSRFYVVREKSLHLKLSELIKEKCKLLEKVSLAQKEYEDLESSLKEPSKVSTETQNLKTTYENLERHKSQLEDEILSLEKKLEEERAKHEQDELMTDISKRIQSLESASKCVKTQLTEAKTNISIFQMNEKHLKEVIQDTLNENYQLEESLKELLEEFEKTKEQTDELNNQKAICGRSKVQAEQVLNEKENEIKSLMESLLKTKVWTCLFGDDITDYDGPVFSKLELRKNETKVDPGNSTVPNSVPAEFEAAGPGFIPSPVPQDRGPRGPPIAEDPRSPIMSRPPLFPPPPLGNIHASPPDYFTPRDFADPPFPPYPDEPKSSEMMSMKNYSKSKPGNSTVPISPTEFEAAGPGFIPPPVPQDRVPRGPLFAEDPRSPIMSWPLPFPPPPPAINLAVPPGYFTARDFSGPPFLPPPRDFPGLPFAPYPVVKVVKIVEPKTFSGLLPAEMTKNSTLPNSPPAEFEAAGPGFIPSPVPQDRGPRSLPFPLDPRSPIMRRPPPFPAPPPGNMHAGPPGYLTPRHFNGPYLLPACPPDRFHPRDFPGPPFLRYPDEPESLEMTSTKNNRKSDPGKSTVPNSLPAEFEAASTDFIPPPIPQDRDPRGPLFAGDPRSPVMSRPPPFPPPTPGNIHPVPPCYFISRDFAGPPFLPYPGRNVNEPRGFLPFLPARAGFVPLPLHPESRNELPPDFIMSSKQPAPELLETQET